jgi:hypothetical protein
VRGAAHEEPPARHDRDVGGDGLDVGRDVGGEHDHPVRGEVAQQVAQHDALLGVQAGRRLVDDEHARIGEQRLRDADPAEHAARVAAERPLAGSGKVEDLEQLADPGAGGASADALDRGEVGQELRGAQVRVHAEVLREVAEAAAERVRTAHHVGAVEQHLPAAGPGHRGGDPHEGRLAGAVRTEQSDQAVAQAQGDGVDGARAAAVLLHDVHELEYGLHVPMGPSAQVGGHDHQVANRRWG